MNSCRSRTLMVDDDPALMGVLKARLTRWGFEVVPASHGIDAMIRVHRSGSTGVLVIRRKGVSRSSVQVPAKTAE